MNDMPESHTRALIDHVNRMGDPSRDPCEMIVRHVQELEDQVSCQAVSLDRLRAFVKMFDALSEAGFAIGEASPFTNMSPAWAQEELDAVRAAITAQDMGEA